MVKRGRKPILTSKESQWAYKKWCEGYTQQEIADALYVNPQTIRKALDGKKKVKPTLVYYGKIGA